MKMRIKSTEEWISVSTQKCRIWTGRCEETGQAVVAFVAAVAVPQDNPETDGLREEDGPGATRLIEAAKRKMKD